MAKNIDQGEDSHLIQALTRLLKPLVRYLLARGFTYTRLIQIIRPLYVSLAESEYSHERERLTDSRISVLTGLARRYVKELRQHPVPSNPGTLKSSPGTKLIAEWVTNKQFLDTRGRPRKLARYPTGDGKPDFETLANLASSDVHSRTLLDDLKSKEMIQITTSGKIALLTSAYRADKQTGDLIDYFGQHLHDHLAAATNNLQRNKDHMFERSAFQDRLSRASIDDLNALTDELGMEMLRKIYARASELAERDRTADNSTYRFRLGAYNYFEEETE